MPKQLLKRIMPDAKTIRNHKHLRIFGTLLHSANLWHLNKRSASGAFAVGLFMCFVPVPFQMVLAAAGAIAFQVNLPLSVALVWITNPVTMPPIFYSSYLVGTWLIGTPEGDFNFELTIDWLINGLGAIWQPFLLGCFVCGSIASVTSYALIRLLWRLNVMRQWNKRSRQR
jgi:uncharacterized protein (DUF2062 family)